MSLRALDNQDPVTSLSFFGESLLVAAAGSFLKLYNWRCGQLLISRKLFEVNKVHGVCFYGESSAVAWGGDSVALISKVDDLRVKKLYVCKDRVTDVAIFNRILFILTAHNEVLEVELSSMSLQKTHRCEERSILYSGSLYLSNHALHVAAGTVFGGVVIWSLHNDSVVQTFEMHEGSIFDVTWSQDGKRIASCSDDRAVFVLDIESGKVLAQGWGHISRVWKVKFVSQNLLVTGAEDCSARVWRLPEKGTDLDCVRIFTGHKGRSVWSLGVEREEKVIATGGGDGKIMLWDLSSHDAAVEERFNIDLTLKVSIRSLALSESTGALIATSNDGSVYTKTFEASEWRQINVDLGPAPIVKKSSSKFFLLSLNGQGAVLNEIGDKLFEFSLPFTILDFFVLNEINLVVIPAPPLAVLLVVNLIGKDVSWSELRQRPGAGVITCACDVSSVFQDTELHICLGSRNGCLMLYSVLEPEPLVVVPAALDSKTDAITSLRIVAKENSNPHIAATARSSDFGFFSLPSMQRMFKNRARKRGSIEGMRECDSDMLFWGFQNDLFVVWNADHGYEMASSNCGGSHRAWDCSYTAHGLYLTYFRKPDIVVQRLYTPSRKFTRSLLQPGTHGREIRGMELCPTNTQLLATASEDTTMALSWLNENGSMAKTACSINDGHVSGIQCLRWHPNGEFLFTGAGKGELIMWQVHVKGDSVFAKEVSRMPTNSAHIDELRVMDISLLVQGGETLIATAFSDSSFRIWKTREIDQNRFKWDLLLEEKYGERCLLNINLREWCRGIYLFYSSTDGCLLVHKLSITRSDSNQVLTAQQKLQVKLHQSGVRCSLLQITDSGSLVVYTGGEDNALSAVKLVCENDEVSHERLFMREDAHSSAVTSLQCLENRALLISTGSDQKVRLWTLDGRLLGSAFTDVCDTGVLVATEKRVITGGIGLQFFELF